MFFNSILLLIEINDVYKIKPDTVISPELKYHSDYKQAILKK